MDAYPHACHLELQFDPYTDVPDERLIGACREGCDACRAQAVERLLSRYRPSVERWCRRFMGDREQALDLTQEILFRAYRSLDHYRGDCRFSTWLYVIARNQCNTALHRRASEPVWQAKEITGDLPDAACLNGHREFEREQHRQGRWRMILGCLNQTEAKVLLMHYGSEMPLSAVGKTLGLTNKSGAKAFIVSARRKLAAIGATC